MNSTGIDTSVAFRRALQRLKQRGCALLVVGAVSAAVRSRASSQMLGASELRRYRLFVTSEDASPLARFRVPSTCEWRSHSARRLTREPDARSTTARPRTVGDDRVLTPDADAELSTTCSEITAAISAFETAAGGFEPGDLRVRVDVLRSLLDEHEIDDVFRFCHRLSAVIRGSRGMGHFLFPVDRRDESVAKLAPSFDAIVELRATDDGREQERWHLPTDGLVTDWLPL